MRQMRYVIACEGVPVDKIAGTLSYRKCPDPHQGAYIDRHESKRSRTPWVRDARTRSTPQGAQAMLRAAQAGKYGTLETGYKIIRINPVGDYGWEIHPEDPGVT